MVETDKRVDFICAMCYNRKNKGDSFMSEFKPHPIKVTEENVKTGEVETYYIHTEFDEESFYDVSKAWEEMECDIWDEAFELSKFQKLAHMTFKLLQPHFRRDPNAEHLLPADSVVMLLLSIHTFADNRIESDSAVAAAKQVAQGFISNVIYGTSEELSEEETAKTFRFDCDETGETYDINADIFDLTEVIRDIEEEEM